MSYTHSNRQPFSPQWVECTKWSENWEKGQKCPGGGQGETWQARQKSDGQKGFLKIIRNKNDPERRRRFFREATAYHTMSSLGIPQLIESNAHLYNSSDVVPYIVTEFIEGPILLQWRETQTHVDLDVAIRTTRKLLAVLMECHASGLVHRDVKPDNIILRDGDHIRPVLLDFGLNFHKDMEIDLITETQQELGNRFLRLPELASGSLLKQDPRSDLSFTGGILYFLLTGQYPNILHDGEGRMPHQRGETLERLKNVSGIRFQRLLALFDKAFEPRIAYRLANGEEMLQELRKVMEPPTSNHSEQAILQDIAGMMNTDSLRRSAETHARIAEALERIQRVHESVRLNLREVGVHLNWLQSGYSIVGQTGKNTLGWTKPADKECVLSVVCDVQETGDEIVICLSGEPVYRLPVDSPQYNEHFCDAIRTWLIKQLHEKVKHV